MATDFAALIADRLRQAREELEMTLERAASLAGFNNYQTLSSIEKGERSVKVAELALFARIYGRSLGYFLDAGPQTPKPAVRWRNAQDTEVRLETERRFLQFCEDYARLEGFARVRPGSLPLLCNKAPSGYSEAETLASDACKLMELGSRPALALRDILEEKYGVKVLVEYTDGGSAACTRGEFGAGIFVNASDRPWRQKFDIAHELYHLVTWEVVESGSAPEPESLDEKYANHFASVLLLPRDSIVDEFQRRLHSGALSFADIVAMAREFGVSVDALLWRLVNLKLVEKASVEQALANENLRQTDRVARLKDRAQQPARPSARFVSLAFECLQNGTLSRGRFAEMLGIRRGHVGTFLAEYGFDETGDYTGQVSAT
jgi:Zn-dependent peptidase ImmA (M78 family)/transcriptional regulator with XRE-family HTH domain